MASDAPGIARRLADARQNLGLSRAALSQMIGLSASAIKYLEGGHGVPNGDSLLKYENAGINPGWLLSGLGPMRLDGPSEVGVFVAGDELVEEAPVYDDALMGKVLDAIGELYKEENVRVSLGQLGTIAMAAYREIVTAATDPDEYPARLDLAIIAERRRLRASKVDPIGTKHSA